MEIAIISDTHMPRGARRLPAECVAALARAELIVHTGDFVELSVLRLLETYGQVVAVHGNVDEPSLRRMLPRTRTIDVAGATLGLVHDAGPARGRFERLRRQFPDADAVVFGHSHLPLYERAADGFQILNPGSPTERRRAPHTTIGLGHAEAGHIGFELVRVG